MRRPTQFVVLCKSVVYLERTSLRLQPDPEFRGKPLEHSPSERWQPMTPILDTSQFELQLLADVSMLSWQTALLCRINANSGAPRLLGNFSNTCVVRVVATYGASNCEALRSSSTTHRKYIYVEMEVRFHVLLNYPPPIGGKWLGSPPAILNLQKKPYSVPDRTSPRAEIHAVKKQKPLAPAEKRSPNSWQL